MEIFGVIAARKGSKGLPGKHAVLLNGKPELAYVIESCLESRLLSKIALSTDDEGLKEIADPYGIIYIPRPPELALDESPIEEAARHALGVTYGANLPEITVLLQGNIPYKKKGIIDQVIAELLQDDTLDSSVTIYCPDPHLYSLKFIENGVLKPVFSARDIYRRQEAQRYYIIDGSVYAIRTETLMATRGQSGLHIYLGDRIKGVEQEKVYGIEIDDIHDLDLVRFYMSKHNQEI